MIQLISHDICICTRGRSVSLLELLDSLAKCDNIRLRSIRVVINGEEPPQELLNEIEEKRTTKKLNLKIEYSEPGLTKARNHALATCSSDLITFIDDDVTVDPDCFDKIETLFHENKTLVGSTPIIDGMYSDLNDSFYGRLKHKRIKRRLQGKITKSGSNFWFIDHPNAHRTNLAMWLPGCFMTYRRSMLNGLKFAEELQNGPTGGYSLGEDVIFSTQSRKFGELRLNCSTRIYHQKAEGVRDNHIIMAVAVGKFLAYQTREQESDILRHHVLARLLTEQILLIAVNVIKPIKRLDELKWKTLEMQSFFQELKLPSLISGGIENER
jgi:glycosyltransferase involved in cell wall biosynthesis